MKKQQIKAFTLVELIIVITILAILATIGFMSYQSYTSDARDGKRKRDLASIRSGLEVYQAKNATLPSPDTQTINIMNGSNTISIQGYAGNNVLKYIKSTNDIKDTLDNNYYTYTVNTSKTKYQLLSMLEINPANISYNSITNKAYAIDYTNRFAYSLGNIVGVFFSGITNIPLQESTGGSLNIASSSTQYKVIFSNNDSNSGTVIATGSYLPKIIDEKVNPNSFKNTIRRNYPLVANYVDSLTGSSNIPINIGSLGGVPYIEFIGISYNNNALLNQIVNLIIQEKNSLFTNNFNFNPTNPIPYPIIQSFKHTDIYPSVNRTDYGYNFCDGTKRGAVDKNLSSYNDHIFTFFPCTNNYAYNYMHNIQTFLYSLK